MARFLIGAGGWAYFEGPSGNRLHDYARAFSFAEANATFYRLPSLSTGYRWRRSAPRDFSFSMKAPGFLTHRARLRPGVSFHRAAVGAARFAAAIRATDFVVETPPMVLIGAREREGLRDIRVTLSAESPGTRLGLEARAYRRRALPRALGAFMAREEVTDVVDFSVASPRVPSDVAYARLFGPGEGNLWEFTDAELRALQDRADDVRAERTVFAFHGVRMYKDAARFLSFRRTGSFPPSTRGTGLASLEEVLRDGGASFPATGQELLATHGWRVIDLHGRSEHASVLLGSLTPDRTFGSIYDVLWPA